MPKPNLPLLLLLISVGVGCSALSKPKPNCPVLGDVVAFLRDGSKQGWVGMTPEDLNRLALHTEWTQVTHREWREGKGGCSISAEFENHTESDARALSVLLINFTTVTPNEALEAVRKWRTELVPYLGPSARLLLDADEGAEWSLAWEDVGWIVSIEAGAYKADNKWTAQLHLGVHVAP